MKIEREIKDYIIIVALMLLQLAITIPFINSFPVGLDEPFSVFYAQQDIKDFVPFLLNGNNPPLHFVLLHYWIDFFGISPTSVRSLSLLFSILTIPVLYMFGKKIVKKQFVIALVLFFIFSTFNHYHALEARVYSLMVFLVVYIFYEVYKLIFLNKFNLFVLAVLNVSLMYAHYLGGIVIIVEVLMLLIFNKRLNKKMFQKFVVSAVVSLILYIPGFVVFFERIKDFTNNGTWVEAPKLGELHGNVVRFLNGDYSVMVLVIIIITLLLLNRKSLLKNGLSNLFVAKHNYIFLIFTITYLGMFVFSVVNQPIFVDRYLLFTSPFIYFSVIIVFRFFSSDTQSKFVSFIVILPMIVFCEYYPNSDRDPNLIANFIKSKYSPSSKILICPPFYDLTFIYHFDEKLFMDYKGIHKLPNNSITPIYSLKETDLSNSDTVFFVDAKSDFLFPNNSILLDLKQNYTLTNEQEFKGGYKVYQLIKK